MKLVYKQYKCPRCGHISVRAGIPSKIRRFQCSGKGCSRRLTRRHQVE